MKASFFTVLLIAASFAASPVVVSCRTTQPASTQLSDSAITTKVKAKFVADAGLNPFNISVETNEGVVYLIGRVPDEGDKREAEELASDTEGVIDVVNHIEIGDMDEES